MAKQDEFVRVTIRIPPALHRKLAEAAQADSMNSQIITRLERSFDAERRFEILSRMSKEALLQVAIGEIGRNLETLDDIRRSLSLFEAAPSSSQERGIESPIALNSTPKSSRSKTVRRGKKRPRPAQI
jgi:hypothetical protein